MKNYLINDRIERGLTQITKTGPLRQKDRLKELHTIYKLIYKYWNYKVDYDVYHSSDRWDTITFSEILSNGLFLTPCNDELRFYFHSLHNKKEDLYEFDIRKKLISNFDDKYRLIKNRGKSYKKLIVPPGGNLFEKAVDREKLQKELNDGAVIKPHPVSNPQFISFLNREFGKDRVLNPKTSGMDLVLKAEKIITCSTSELGFVAALLEKEVEIIDTDYNRAIYKPLYDSTSLDKDSISKLFFSSYSGIFWKWDPEEKLKSIINNMIESYKCHE